MERKHAREVCNKLNHERLFREHIKLTLIAWDQPGVNVAMEAGLTPQKAIESGLPSPRDCDLVIGIFWARLGTPLPVDQYVKSDGTPFRSGSEWEILDALDSCAETQKPTVWIYHRTDPFMVAIDDPNLDQQRVQWMELQALLGSFRGVDDSILGGLNKYFGADNFRALFEDQLRAKLATIRDEGRPQASNSQSSERCQELTTLIEEFFQPIHNKLRYDTAIWKGIIRDRDSPDSLQYRMAYELEMKQVIPNHLAIAQIVEERRHLVRGDAELSDVLDQYLRHVSTFKALRDAGEMWEFPELHDHPWPQKLVPLIESRLSSLRREKSLLGQLERS